MTSFDDAPVFGSRVAGCAYVVRPSAYALMQDAAGALAIVRTPSGCYLPGGGVEASETPDQTVVREAREEAGLLVSRCVLLGRAIEIVYSVSEQTCFEKRSTFLVAEVTGATTALESDHELVWLSADAALQSLKHESHRWAVRRLLLERP